MSSTWGLGPYFNMELDMSNVDFLTNDDGTISQNNLTGIDQECNGLGHTDDISDWGASDDDFSSSDDW